MKKNKEFYLRGMIVGLTHPKKAEISNMRKFVSQWNKRFANEFFITFEHQRDSYWDLMGHLVNEESNYDYWLGRVAGQLDHMSRGEK